MARIREAIEWIADNDNNGEDTPENPDAEVNVAGYISTALVADLFGKSTEYIAEKVMAIRRRQTKEARP